MIEFEQSIYKRDNKQPLSIVSDRERARRMPSDYINANEIVAPMGNFNAADGTTHGSEAEADLASERYLTGREGDLSLTPLPKSSRLGRVLGRKLGRRFGAIDGLDYATDVEARVANERFEIAHPAQEPVK